MRVKQIRRWVLAGRATSFDEMSDLPKDLRRQWIQGTGPATLTAGKQESPKRP